MPGLSKKDANLLLDLIYQTVYCQTREEFKGVLQKIPTLFPFDYTTCVFLRKESGKDNYENGIRASLEYWGVGDAADAYLQESNVAYDAGKAITLITEQKWMAIFGQGVEAYAEIRRTHTPSRIFEYELEATEYPGRGLPVRLAYSPAEESYNGKNLNEAKTRQGIEAVDNGMFGARVWWDVKPNPIPTVKDPQIDY